MVILADVGGLAKSAFREHRAQPRLEKLQSRLESAKSNLAICFMVYTLHQDQQRAIHSDATNQKHFTSLETTIKNEALQIRSVCNAYPGLMDEINKLTKAMTQTSRDEENYTPAVDLMIENHDAALEEIKFKLDQQFQSQSDNIQDLREKVGKIQRLADREMEAIGLVIHSLIFDDMSDRLVSIKRPHDGTFEWIFCKEGDASQIYSNFTRWLTDVHVSPVYWIRGKPGSGKSTLLKEIFEVLTEQKGRGWHGSEPITLASCFFWSAGTREQRSLQGLLRCILHQILQSHPHLVQSSIGAKKWQHTYQSSHCGIAWSVDELQRVLRKSIEQLVNENDLLLLLDGLDEFEGDDDERQDLIEFLEGLTQNRWVKVCVSSRPWNIFRDAFASYPQLRLEELTHDDIEKYVNDTFKKDKLLMRKLGRQTDMLQKLTNQVVLNAEGVFLWVRLVVRDLLKSVRDGCQPNRLFNILNDIPRDLDDYFVRMLHQMDPAYRRDAALILRLKLCDEIYKFDEGNQLRLFDLLHLDESAEDEYFLLSPSYETFSVALDGMDVVEEQFDTLERRLTSRTMGLLEVLVHSREPFDLMNADVVYLHRTVKDFLCTIRAQKELEALTDDSFNPLAFRCSSFLDKVMMLELNYRCIPKLMDTRAKNWVHVFLDFCQNSQLDSNKMIELYDKAASSTAVIINLYTLESQRMPCDGVIDVEPDLYLDLAIRRNGKHILNHFSSVNPMAN